LLRDEQRKRRAAIHRQAGNRAEQLAARFLGQRGLTVLHRNYRCRAGEIDVIARDGEALVFIEVRLRNNLTHGAAVETVTPAKQRRIIRSASHFLLQNPVFSDIPCRFDVLGIRTDGEGAFRFSWIKDAFHAVC